MTRDEVLTQMQIEQEDCDSISDQLGKARSNAAEGNYSDPDWYRRAERALRGKRRTVQRLQREAAEMRRAEAKRKADTFGQAFMDVAAKVLGEEKYVEIYDRARMVTDDDSE